HSAYSILPATMHTRGHAMMQRWLFSCLAAVLNAAPLAAAPAPAKGSTAAAPASKAAKKARPTAKPKGAPTAMKPMPGPMGMHMPPMPPPSSATTHRQYDVPQAKTLSQTPDVILNSRVRAALISSLSGIGAQDINPE